MPHDNRRPRTGTAGGAYRFAEIETLAKHLYGGTEWEPDGIHEGNSKVPSTIGAKRAFDLAEEFYRERDRRKAEL